MSFTDTRATQILGYFVGLIAGVITIAGGVKVSQEFIRRRAGRMRAERDVEMQLEGMSNTATHRISCRKQRILNL